MLFYKKRHGEYSGIFSMDRGRNSVEKGRDRWEGGWS